VAIINSIISGVTVLALSLSSVNVLAATPAATPAATLEGTALAAADYLPDDLRSRVTRLKADIDVLPTDPANAKARAEVMWEWLNAYAVNGGYIPVNATRVVSTILGQPGNITAIKALDEVIREFTFLDDFPNALGTLNADLGPFTARTYATINQTYTVGERSIQTGGGVMVARHFIANFGAWQANEASAANYISIKSSNPKVSFAVTSLPLAGMHGGFRNTRPTLTFKLASGTLIEGDTITLTFGDTSSGSPGLMMPSMSSDHMPLPLYLSFTASGQFFSLPIQPKITGQPIHGVAGFAPSIVKPQEKFKLSIRAQDKFFNRASGPIPNWTVSLDNETWLEVDSEGVITNKEVSLLNEGVYFPVITSVDGNISGETNPILVTSEDRDRIYWGDTHGHSGFAEGIGTPDRFMQWARDDARLDYVTHSEHDVWLDDAEWDVLRDNVEKYTEQGEFIAYLGYEWTVRNIDGGHHNVLYRTPQNRLRIPVQFYPTLSQLYQGLRNHAATRDVVVIPHAHQAGDYRQSDPDLEPLVEVMSQHGSFEWFGKMYLQQGNQVGFTAASDNHLSQPGYSAPLGGSLSQRGGLGAIMARERTTDAIFDGMKGLRSYATTGDRIILDFAVNGAQMGQRAPFSESRVISGKVIGTAPIDTITVIKNGDMFWQESYIDYKGSKTSKTGTFLLSFASESQPFHPGDNPRGWRAWEGTLEVHNADLVSFESVDSGFYRQSTEHFKDKPNQLRFSTKTRGDTSSYLLRLENIQRTTRLQFDIVENAETGGGPPVYRPHKRVPADSFSLAIRDLDGNKVNHTQQVDAYTDSTVLRQVIESGERVISFEVKDSSARQGDYYYVRVVLANDAIAWSSPVWVGGHAKR